MVEAFAHRLRPVILSLGSSRKLVPNVTVLYGNLPTKSFYSDGAMPVEVMRRIRELVARKKACRISADEIRVTDSQSTEQRTLNGTRSFSFKP
jgi:hypothetical protein